MDKRTHVVGGIRMVVNTTEEGHSGIFADVLAEQVATTGMLVKERRHVMDEASNDEERTLLCLFLDYDDVNDRIFRAGIKDSQESQLTMGRSFDVLGQTILSWTLRSFLSSMVSWPLRISLSGKVLS